MSKHTYRVPLKEFLKLFKCLASSDIYMISWCRIFQNKDMYESENVNVNIYLLFLKYSYNEGGSMNDITMNE